MVKVVHPVSKEVIDLVGSRIIAAQCDLYNMMRLAASLPEQDATADMLAIGGAIEALAARCGRILDTCAEKLGTLQAGHFSDFEIMEDCQERFPVRSGVPHA